MNIQAKTVARGSDATPATLAARIEHDAARLACDTIPASQAAPGDAVYERFAKAEKALLLSPTRTVEDIALKLEYALNTGLIGGQMGADFEGLDSAMFRDMIVALRNYQTGA